MSLWAWEGMTRKPGVRRITRPAADVEAATRVALRRGGSIDRAVAPQIASWRMHGDCLTPMLVWDEGFGHFSMQGRNKVWVDARTLQRTVRCRKCSNCLRAKSSMWGDRSVIEWQQALYHDRQGKPRGSWFGTLTFAPEHKYRLLLETRARLAQAGGDLEKMSATDRFTEICVEILEEGTKYLKRLRKAHKQKGKKTVSFRYLMVVEAHKSGEPHLHLLIHEGSALEPIVKTRLERHWPFGLTHFRIVKTERECRYVSKYIGKYNVARMRSSIRYGKNKVDAESVTHILEDLLAKQQQVLSTSLGTQKENIDPPNTTSGVPTEGGDRASASLAGGPEGVMGTDPSPAELCEQGEGQPGSPGYPGGHRLRVPPADTS